MLSILIDLDRLLLDLLDLRLLVNDLLIELLEEQCELGHSLLDALDVVVAGADGTKDA
jgi:hypothetical protein